MQDETFFASLTGAGLNEDSYGAVPARYGTGGAPDVGAAIGAVGGVIDSVANAAYMAIEQQNQAHIMARNNVDKLSWAMTALDRLLNERSRILTRLREAKAWMDRRSNKRKWITAGLADKGPNARGQTMCKGMFEGIALPGMIEENVVQRKENPGGHAEWVLHCRCPYDKCAYKQSTQVDWDRTRLQGKDAMIRLRSVEWGDPAAMPGVGLVLPPRAPLPFGAIDAVVAGGAGVGNIAEVRAKAALFWTHLISLEGYREMLLAATGQPIIWNSELLLDANTLKKLFVSGIARSPGWTPDPDAKVGRVPAHIGAALVAKLLSFYALGIAPADTPVPLWALGFNKDELATYTVGPTAGQVAQVNKVMWGEGGLGNTIQANPTTPRFSGVTLHPEVVRYGSAPARAAQQAPEATPLGLRNALRSLVTSGRMGTIPSAPPVVIPGAVAMTAPVLTQTEQARVTQGIAQAEKKNFWARPEVKIGAGIAAGTTLLGMTALVISSLRR